jgi:hypothetical protein
MNGHMTEGSFFHWFRGFRVFITKRELEMVLFDAESGCCSFEWG